MFIAVVAGISAVAWLYLLGARGRFLLGAIRGDGITQPPRHWPCVAAVIPARNEADVINASVGALLRQDYRGLLLVGLAVWLAMALSFQPTLRDYRLLPLWGLALPAISLFYAVYTLDSVYQHARKRGGQRKGRVYVGAPSPR